MKKLIIGLGFTTLLAATCLHAGLSQEQLSSYETVIQRLDQWAALPGRTINQATLQNLTNLATYPEGQALIAKYSKVRDQLQAHTTKTALATCAQAIAKLPPAAQKSCMARFKGSVASFITKHKTGINRTVMLALLAGSIYWVCTTHPEILDNAKVMIDQVKDHMRAGFGFITQTVSSYVSSAWNATKNFFGASNPQTCSTPAQSIAAVNTLPNYNYASCAVNDPCLETAQSWLQGNRSALTAAQTRLQEAEAILAKTPTLAQSSWWQKVSFWPGSDAIQKAYHAAQSAVLSAKSLIYPITQNIADTEKVATQCSTVWR